MRANLFSAAASMLAVSGMYSGGQTYRHEYQYRRKPKNNPPNDKRAKIKAARKQRNKNK